MSEGNLIIVGASTRAAAMTARRAGFTPWCIDMFTDRDLRAIAEVRACDPSEFPERLPELARDLPPGPWMYTGGLENHPAVVAKLAADRPLIGNGPEVIEQVRDPFRLEAALREAGFPALRTVRSGEEVPLSLNWLVKPLRGTGGIGIRPFEAGETLEEGVYLQEFKRGRSRSVIGVAGEAGAYLYGSTHQFIGDQRFHAEPYRYCGNLASKPQFKDEFGDRLQAMVNLLVEKFQLRHFFGVDFIESEDGPWVTEVNPRYTASVELLERVNSSAEPVVMGKAILFAPVAFTFPSRGPWDADIAAATDPKHWPTFADLPHPGERIEQGWPVLTFFDEGPNVTECARALSLRAVALTQQLFE